MKRILLFAATLLAAFLMPNAKADSIVFTINNPTQSVAPGGTVTFTATVSAPNTNGGTIYLNADSVNTSSPVDPGDIYVDDTDFLNNFFPLSFDPGDSITADLFTVTLPLDAPDGYYYSGTFTLQGGVDFFTADNLGTQNFSVATLVSAIPEPPANLLCLTGFAGVGLLVFKSRKYKTMGR
jgi:hypothetical protein